MHYIWEIVIYAMYRVYAPVPCNNQCYNRRTLCVLQLHPSNAGTHTHTRLRWTAAVRIASLTLFRTAKDGTAATPLSARPH